MSKQFKEQGGVATMDPSPIRRWLTSKLMTTMFTEKRLVDKRNKSEKQRIKTKQAHIVEYFHQIDDGYSYLASQLLKPLLDRYDIQLVCHLVSGPEGANSAEPELLSRLSKYDSACIAEDYGLEFPKQTDSPSGESFTAASKILASLDSMSFIENGAEIGRALWSNANEVLLILSDKLGSGSLSAVKKAVQEGNQRRAELKHYSGGMFHYEGEWYWGVDRLYHLEQRLCGLGLNKSTSNELLVPRPEIDFSGPLTGAESLTLEVYPSLRSPYTAISFDLALKLASSTGVKLVVRPVLPMVMRGVPATKEKGMYIFADAAREARAAGVLYGNFYDPIGEPVRLCYSLYPWACEQGKGKQLISSFLSAAFAQGINTNTRKGLRKVIENATLDWNRAIEILGTSGWEEELELNRQSMYQAGLWGVPSFRLLGANGEQLLALWGQDRLWLIAREIHRQLKDKT